MTPGQIETAGIEQRERGGVKHFVYALVEGTQVRYVGYSAALGRRRKEHLAQHPEWRMRILGEYPTRESGLEHERSWIARLHDEGHPLTNVSEGGLGGVVGEKRSFLTRSRMSVAQKGHHMGNHNAAGHRVSAEARAKMAPWKGKHPSAETRARLSASLKGKNAGRVFSAEVRAKNSAARKGKPWSLARRTAFEQGVKVTGNRLRGRTLSAERRAKISAAAKRQFASPEARAKSSAARRGNPWSVARRAAYERSTYHPSPETRARMSAAQKGKKRTPEARARMSLAQAGNKNGLGPHRCTPEGRARMSAAAKGNKHGAANAGRTWTPEQRSRIAVSLQGRHLAPEHRVKLLGNKNGRGGLGRKHSPETRAKMSTAQLRRWAKRTPTPPETRARMSAAARRKAAKARPEEPEDMMPWL